MLTREHAFFLAFMWTWGIGVVLVRGLLRLRRKVERENALTTAAYTLITVLWPVAIPVLVLLEDAGFGKKR